MLSLSEYLEKPEAPSELPATDFSADGVDRLELPLELQNASIHTISAETAPRIVMLTEPKSPGADRFRYLRMRLRELRALVRLKTLVITSALPQDGKSTVALNLATALAESGRRRVLLVEADLHCPSLSNTLGVGEAAGLAECLEEDLAPLPAIKRIEPVNWYFLPAGHAVGNPTELLQSTSFAGVMEKVAPYFDWILIDTPPVEPLSDALLAAKHADASLLVVRANRTPQAAVDEALSLLNPQRVAAIVFNGAEGLNNLYSKYSGYYGRK
ncbi:MAG: CpsD/CapB family tyrosine-protein kinase [Acidobacteria bacterium]|nr:CpsD/CapB family tyrosine-protein kinase [Acidobacteriota bacterium]